MMSPDPGCSSEIPAQSPLWGVQPQRVGWGPHSIRERQPELVAPLLSSWRRGDVRMLPRMAALGPGGWVNHALSPSSALAHGVLSLLGSRPPLMFLLGYVSGLTPAVHEMCSFPSWLLLTYI